jgi:uncharacterized secreted repeat protein (TIGR03808 family)
MRLLRPDRRSVLALFALTPAAALAREGTERLQADIDAATKLGRPCQLPAETVLTGTLRLPDGAHLIGNSRSRLLLAGNAPLIEVARGASVRLEGVTLDGGSRAGGRERGLLHATDAKDLIVESCEITRFGGNGLHLERSAGRISNTRIAEMGRSGLFALDSRGLVIEGNTVSRCGENGLSVWRSAKGDDGTVLRANRISDIRADAGGTGQYGNGIAVFRAGGVIVEGNQIRRCRYTAVRCNSTSNVIVQGNNCQGFGETALYVEFAFDGAVVANNIVQDAWEGLQVTNFADHGGRLATVSGNVFRDLKAGPHIGDGSAGGGRGVFVEGDCAVTGNVIDRAARIGLQLGWGPSLRDVVASGNLVRDTEIGIAVSVAPGAGQAQITGNRISEARRFAIVGMEWTKVATGDLSKAGSRHERVIVSGNVVGASRQE